MSDYDAASRLTCPKCGGRDQELVQEEGVRVFRCSSCHTAMTVEEWQARRDEPE